MEDPLSARPSTLRLMPGTDRVPSLWTRELGLLPTLAGSGLLILLCITFIDATAAQLRQASELPGELAEIVRLSEVFAHGGGIIVLLLVLAHLTPNHRKRLRVVAICSLGSGLLADVVKLFVQRIRPRAVTETVVSGFESFHSILESNPVGLFAPGANQLQSFPSAHAATAFGLAFGLAWCYGKGSRMFLVLASMASFQRFYAGAHWPSDLIAGATIGYLFSQWVIARTNARAQTKNQQQPQLQELPHRVAA